MTDEPVSEEILDVKHCAGCRNDFYNDKNPLGVKMCWSRKGAKLAKRVLIHIDKPPPYIHELDSAEELPTCYHAERYVTVSPDRIDSTTGYWK